MIIKNILIILMLFSSINLFCMSEGNNDPFSRLSPMMDKMDNETLSIFVSVMGELLENSIRDIKNDSIKLDLDHFCMLEEKVFKSLVKYLIQKCGKVNILDKDGNTALMWAITKDYTDITKLLINNNADLNIQNNRGKTALHLAVKWQRIEIIELLLNKDADTTLKDKDDKIFIDYIENGPDKEKIKTYIRTQVEAQLSEHIPIRPLCEIITDYLFDKN